MKALNASGGKLSLTETNEVIMAWDHGILEFAVAFVSIGLSSIWTGKLSLIAVP